MSLRATERSETLDLSVRRYVQYTSEAILTGIKVAKDPPKPVRRTLP
jgi:hypothetical protein